MPPHLHSAQQVNYNTGLSLCGSRKYPDIFCVFVNLQGVVFPLYLSQIKDLTHERAGERPAAEAEETKPIRFVQRRLIPMNCLPFPTVKTERNDSKVQINLNVICF